MQLANTKSGTVIQGGISETTNFRIEADGKMFRLLSDTLYQNKIGSMVREVSCNAYDSHVAAGIPEAPFTIHAPTNIEPWFSVIDHGIGLSHDDVCNIFTCFGKSTKTGSNSMVGAFGFGSKTPFAYTNAFTVVSVKDGIRNCYSAVIGEDGLPAMNLMDSSETTDANGVEITVAVETYDFHDFYSEIASQLRYFKVKPIVKGYDIKFQDPYESVFETVDANTHFRRGRANGVEVVQGGVAYPVDLSQLSKGLDSRPELRKFITGAINSYNPIFLFEIGEIGVTPSRESISYDTKTVKNILDRIEYVQTTLVNRVLEKMKEADTIWAKTVALRQNSDLFSKLFDFSNNIWGVASEGNQPYVAIPETILAMVNTGSGKLRHHLTRFSPTRTNGGKFRVTMDAVVEKIIPEGDMHIIIDDGCGFSHSRVRRLIEETNTPVYLLTATVSHLERRWIIENSDGSTSTREHYGNAVQGDVSPTVLAAFLEAIDGGPVPRFLSEFEKQERVYIIKNADGTTTERVKYTPAKAYKFDSFRHGRTLTTFKNFEKDFVAPKKMTGAVAYVIVDNRKVTSDLTTDEDNFLYKMMGTKDWTMPIFAIREKDAEKVKGNPNWIPVKDALATLRVELLAKYKPLHLREALSWSGSDLDTIVNPTFMTYLANHRDELDDHLLRGMVGRWMRYTKRRSNRNRDNAAMCSYFYGEEMGKIRESISLKDKKRSHTINMRYPILSMFHSGYGMAYTDDLVSDVIAMINSRYNKILAMKP